MKKGVRTIEISDGKRYKVTGSEGGLYRVVDLADRNEISCKPRGRFRHEKMRVLVGDNVTLNVDEQGNRCIDDVLPRKNALLRPRIANADLLFIIFSVSSPDPILLNIDKLTTIAEQNNIRPVLVLSKCELDRDKAEELKEIYKTTGYETFETSCETGEGVDELLSYVSEVCRDQTSVFCGSSGVGKSTLLNALFPTLSQKTQTVSEKIERGRHTTRRVDLFPLGSFIPHATGFIADTPGFSLLDFESFDFYDLDDLPENFPEFRPYLGTCRFTKCTHRKEDGCALLDAMRKGILAPSRMESYATLYGQLKTKHSWEKPSHS